ncbi:MAG TPA: hypothetical protein VKQ73_16830 [Stellaceae bacterium]|nr:hypothetical protein [Stellaceae bacterium]
MRALLALSLLALFYPAAALAQQPAAAPPSAAPSAAPSAPNASAEPAKKATGAAAKRGGDITREEYVERAKANAEKRFDKMDADHDGVLTADERHAYREGHTRHRAAPAPASH